MEALWRLPQQKRASPHDRCTEAPLAISAQDRLAEKRLVCSIGIVFAELHHSLDCYVTWSARGDEELFNNWERPMPSTNAATSIGSKTCKSLPPTSGARRAIQASALPSRNFKTRWSSSWTIGSPWPFGKYWYQKEMAKSFWIVPVPRYGAVLDRRRADRCRLQHQMGFPNRDGRSL